MGTTWPTVTRIALCPTVRGLEVAGETGRVPSLQRSNPVVRVAERRAEPVRDFGEHRPFGEASLGDGACGVEVGDRPAFESRRGSRTTPGAPLGAVEVALVQPRVPEVVERGRARTSRSPHGAGGRDRLFGGSLSAPPQAALRAPPMPARRARGGAPRSSPASRAAATASSASGSAPPPGREDQAVGERRERPGANVGSIRPRAPRAPRA